MKRNSIMLISERAERHAVAQSVATLVRTELQRLTDDFKKLFMAAKDMAEDEEDEEEDLRCELIELQRNYQELSLTVHTLEEQNKQLEETNRRLEVRLMQLEDKSKFSDLETWLNEDHEDV